MQTRERAFDHFAVIAGGDDGGAGVVAHWPPRPSREDNEVLHALPKFCAMEQPLRELSLGVDELASRAHDPSTTSFALGTFIERIYCSCLQTYHVVDEDKQARTVRVRPVWVCVTSKFPFFSLMRKTLRALHDHLWGAPPDLDVEGAVHAMMSTTLPIAASSVCLSFSVGSSTVAWSSPALTSLPVPPPLVSSAAFVIALPISLVLELLGALLLESRVIVCGLSAHQRTQVTLSLASFISPLKWVNALLPVLPPSLVNLARSPLPYVLGVPHEKKQEILEIVQAQAQAVSDLVLDGILVDLEERTVHSFGAAIPTVPRHIQAHLKRRFADIQARLGKLSATELAQEVTFSMQLGMAWLLRKYAKYARAQAVLDPKSSVSLFDVEGFCCEHDWQDKRFFERLCETQHFEQLLTQRLSRDPIRTRDHIIQHNAVAVRLTSLSPPSSPNPSLVPFASFAKASPFLSSAGTIEEDQRCPQQPRARQRDTEVRGFPAVRVERLQSAAQGRSGHSLMSRTDQLSEQFVQYLRVTVAHFPMLAVLNSTLRQRTLVVRRGDWNDRIHMIMAEGRSPRSLGGRNSVDSADFLSIQSAVNAAAPGGKVIVRPGIYTESVVLSRSIMLVGEGLENGDVIIRSPPGSPALTIAAPAATVRNMSFHCTSAQGSPYAFGSGAENEARLVHEIVRSDDHSAACVVFAATAGRSQLSHCVVRSVGAACVLVCKGSSPSLLGCTIENGHGCGVVVADCSQPLLRGNVIRNNLGCGVVVAGGDATPTIVNNRIVGNGGHGVVVESQAASQHLHFDDAVEYGGQDKLRDVLRVFYQAHNPEKLEEVDKISQYYSKGRQPILHAKLKKTYQASIVPSEDLGVRNDRRPLQSLQELEGKFQSRTAGLAERIAMESACVQFWTRAQMVLEDKAVLLAGEVAPPAAPRSVRSPARGHESEAMRAAARRKRERAQGELLAAKEAQVLGFASNPTTPREDYSGNREELDGWMDNGFDGSGGDSEAGGAGLRGEPSRGNAKPEPATPSLAKPPKGENQRLSELSTVQLSQELSVELSQRPFHPKATVIVNNFVSDNRRDGIRLLAGGNHTVQGNTVRLNHHAGIVVSCCAYADVLANSVQSNQGAGVVVTRTCALLRGNILESNKEEGIRLQHDANALVEWNFVGSGHTGLQLCSNSRAVVRGNIVHMSDRHGIEILRGASAKVQHNAVTKTHGCAVYIAAESGHVVLGPNILENSRAGRVWDCAHI